MQKNCKLLTQNRSNFYICGRVIVFLKKGVRMKKTVLRLLVISCLITGFSGIDAKHHGKKDCYKPCKPCKPCHKPCPPKPCDPCHKPCPPKPCDPCHKPCPPKPCDPCHKPCKPCDPCDKPCNVYRKK